MSFEVAKQTARVLELVKQGREEDLIAEFPGRTLPTDIVGKDGTTPAHLIARTGYSSLLPLFEDDDWDAQDSVGDTPLHLTVRNTKIGPLEDFLPAGVGREILNAKGDSPYHEAASVGDLEVAERLVADGHDPQYLEHLNGQGRTCFHVACAEDNSEVAIFFAGRFEAKKQLYPAYIHGDVEVLTTTDKKRQSPVHAICQSSSYALFERFSEREAVTMMRELARRDRHQRTAYWYAQQDLDFAELVDEFVQSRIKRIRDSCDSLQIRGFQSAFRSYVNHLHTMFEESERIADKVRAQMLLAAFETTMVGLYNHLENRNTEAAQQLVNDFYKTSMRYMRNDLAIQSLKTLVVAMVVGLIVFGVTSGISSAVIAPAPVLRMVTHLALRSVTKVVPSLAFEIGGAAGGAAAVLSSVITSRWFFNDAGKMTRLALRAKGTVSKIDKGTELVPAEILEMSSSSSGGGSGSGDPHSSSVADPSGEGSSSAAKGEVEEDYVSSTLSTTSSFGG